MCGLYDTFIDGEKQVQLKNFDNTLSLFKVGDKIPMRRCGYPQNGLFFCLCLPMPWLVIIEKGIFKGIENQTLKIIHKKFPKYRIWDCYGNEWLRK